MKLQKVALNILLIALLPFFLYTFTYGQSTPDLNFKSLFPYVDGRVVYEKVYELDSVSKKEIFVRIKEWGQSTFVTQKGALQSEDSEMGYIFYQAVKSTTHLIPKGWGFSLMEDRYVTVDYNAKMSIKFYIKDEKFKVTISDITNQPVKAYGVWKVGFDSYTGTKAIEVNPIPVESAGVQAIYDYKQNPDQKKYAIRLNYTVNLWRQVNIDILKIFDVIYSEVVYKKRTKSPFDF